MTTAATAQDTLFFDAQEALACARQRQPVQVYGNVHGCQVCYYTAAEELPERLDNLVHLHPSRMLETLVETRLRLPTWVVMPPWLPQDMQADYLRVVQTVLQEAAALRSKRAFDAMALIAKLPPHEMQAGRPLRILAFGYSHTTVTQYSCRGLIQGFQELGHDAHLIIEGNACEDLVLHHKLEAVIELDPDIVIHIDHHCPWYCRSGTIQVVWWQDPMPPLMQPTPLPWRREDLVYIIAGYFRAGVLGTGLAAERIRIQHFCVDDNVFHPPAVAGGRRRAVVFVGTAYGNLVNLNDPGEVELIRRIDALVDAGEPLSTERVQELAVACQVNPDHAVCRTMIYCTRDRFVRMLCRQQAIPVEVYGFGWEADAVVAPFFRGAVAHGPALAELYRSVTHALCLHPFLINHQRLAEIGACGCIPVGWDARGAAEPPHWEEETLYFTHEPGLHAAVAREVPTHPERFRDHFSYRRFAQRILDDARSEGLLPAAP